MKEEYENFADAPKEVQEAAANDVYSLAVKYLQDNPSITQPEAIRLAQKKIASYITDEGKYELETPNIVERVHSDRVIEEPKTKFVEGKVYQDANGNRAKYVKGNWIPQK